MTSKQGSKRRVAVAIGIVGFWARHCLYSFTKQELWLYIYNVCLISLIMFIDLFNLTTCKTSKLPKPTKPLELTPRF